MSWFLVVMHLLFSCRGWKFPWSSRFHPTDVGWNLGLPSRIPNFHSDPTDVGWNPTPEHLHLCWRRGSVWKCNQSYGKQDESEVLGWHMMMETNSVLLTFRMLVYHLVKYPQTCGTAGAHFGRNTEVNWQRGVQWNKNQQSFLATCRDPCIPNFNQSLQCWSGAKCG